MPAIREQMKSDRGRTITCIPILDKSGATDVQTDRVVVVRPNDPLYLMSGTSCPEDFGPGPMFAELEGSPFTVPVRYRRREYGVRIRASYARPHVRDSLAPDAAWPEQYRGPGCRSCSVGQTRGSEHGSLIDAGRTARFNSTTPGSAVTTRESAGGR